MKDQDQKKFASLRVIRGRTTAWCILALAGTLGAAPLRLENQRELFLDDTVLEKLDGAEVRLATPVPAGVVLKFDGPWEGKFSGAFVSVIREKSLFRMYYRGTDGSGGGKSEKT